MPNRYKIQWTMIILAWVTFSISLSWSVFQNDYSWLGRSGSIMVMFCAIGEYHFIKIRMPPPNSTQVRTSDGVLVPAGTPAPKGEAGASFVLHSTLCIGTIVWGYGDLLPSILNFIK